MEVQSQSLVEGFAASSAAANSVVVINSHGVDSLDWASLHEHALRIAAALQADGLLPGHRVALIGETSRELIATIQAVWLAGGTLTVLPLPGRVRDSAMFAAQTNAKLRQLRPYLVAGERRWLRALGLEGRHSRDHLVRELNGLARLAQRRDGFTPFEPAAHDPDRLALLQFTSGTTSEPKAVMVPEGCLRANIGAIKDGLELTPEDRIMSWLPLFHDMGLIGMLTLAMATGASLVLADPGVFAAQPWLWMEWISEFRASISCAPNFAYGLAARSLAAGGSYDLRRWRIAINGAEPIDVPTLERFIAAAGVHGFPESGAFCVYGLAEATLAVTFPSPGVGLQIDVVDRGALDKVGHAERAARQSENSRPFALLGKPLGDFELRVSTPSGQLAADREVGDRVRQW